MGRGRVGYLGPEGTFTHEAALTAPGAGDLELVPLPTIYDTVMAVADGTVDQAVVPIENSVEGSVNATLDALAIETEAVAIVGETILPIRQCLIAREPLELADVEVVVSHPQANGQCARFIRSQLAGAQVMTTSSTADAVRMVAERGGRWAAIGTRVAAERYGCHVLRAGVEDLDGNETRFVWLAPAAAGGRNSGERDAGRPDWKTAIVFWGPGTEAAGWLVACLAEFADRAVNLTRIESRPRREGLGRYMFFADLEGRDVDPAIAHALAGLRGRVEVLRVLGSFPAAARRQG